MEFIMGLGDIKNVEDIIKIFYIIVFTHYMNFKLINKKLEINVKNILIIVLSIFVNIIIYKIMRNALGLSYSIIFIILLISISFKKISKYRFPYSLLVTVISLTINYIIFSLSVIVAFIPIILLNIQNTYIGLILILIINMIIHIKWIFGEFFIKILFLFGFFPYFFPPINMLTFYRICFPPFIIHGFKLCTKRL